MKKATIKKDLNAIARVDKDLALAIEEFGYPEPRIRPCGFETFLSTIVSQQISTEAARAIMSRVHDLLPRQSAEALLQLPEGSLRAAGLSGRKVEYVYGLAEAIVDGRFQPQRLAELADADAIKEIIGLRGFGVWSAEIYLMFSLQRRDIFPADDLALQLALQKLKHLASRPTPKVACAVVAHWAPFRSAGSLFLWHFYRGAPT
ncbi:MAG: DNA-3-methyladenine glycosylase family protein [Pseudomonadales bacterium]